MTEVLECSICDADIPLESRPEVRRSDRMFLLQGHFQVTEGER